MAIGCFVKGDKTARVDLIHRFVLTKSQVWVMSGAHFRVWYGLLSESYDAEVPLDHSQGGLPLRVTHVRENDAVGRPFKDVIVSTSGNDPDWKIPEKETLKERGIKQVISYSEGRILFCDCILEEYTEDSRLTIQTKGEYNRTYVSRAGLPFLTVGVYHYESNATKSYQAVIKNMIRFVNRGLKHGVDVITGDANSASNKINKSQEVQHPQISAINMAMEAIVTCFNQSQSHPLDYLRVSTEVSASKRSIIEAALKHGTSQGIEHDGYFGLLDALVTNIFHWGKTDHMRDCRERHISDDFQIDENQPLGNIYPDYKVSSGERYKLLSNEQLMVGSNDTDWHHPLLVNLDVLYQNANVSESQMKRRRTIAEDRGYSS